MGVQISIRESDMLIAGAKKVIENKSVPVTYWNEDLCDEVPTGDYRRETNVFWDIPGVGRFRSYSNDSFVCDFKHTDEGSNQARLSPWLKENDVPYTLS